MDRYQSDLLSGSNEAQSFLKGIGISSQQTVKTFALGYVSGKATTSCTEEQEKALQEVGVIDSNGTEVFMDCLVVPVMDTQRRILGNDHPSTLNSINGFAVLRTKQKEYDEADKTWRGIDKLGLDYFKEILRFFYIDNIIKWECFRLKF